MYTHPQSHFSSGTPRDKTISDLKTCCVCVVVLVSLLLCVWQTTLCQVAGFNIGHLSEAVMHTHTLTLIHACTDDRVIGRAGPQ